MKKKRTIYETIFKRPIDFLISLTTIIIFSPLMLIIAILVKTKLGSPIIFKQRRIGKNEKEFSIYKFRTMTNERDEMGQFLEGSKRMTKFGNVLRRLSLDELPSLFNILFGQMSIVGPRPLVVTYLEYYNNDEKNRHLVRPGLTGLAQVNGRNYLNWGSRFEYDLKYIEKITFLNDLKIIFKTAIKVFKKEDIVEHNDHENTVNFSDARMQLSNEIGGNFWIDENQPLFTNQEFKKFMKKRVGKVKDVEYISTGREAIKFILKGTKIKIKSALLPYYTCDSVITPFVAEGYEIIYYNLDLNLKIDINELENIIDNKDIGVFLFHNYFGFKTNENMQEILELLKFRHIVIIEDITQNLYSDYKYTNCDYFIGSIRKWYALPDGAILISKNNKFKNVPKDTNDELVRTNLLAFNKKSKYINKLENSKEEFINLFKKTELMISSNDSIYKMSSESREIINSKNINNIQKRRRSNYKSLLEGLKNSNNIKIMFPELKDGVTPLYFVISVENRNDLQTYLSTNGIYCPIIWEKSDYIDQNISKDTNLLYKTLLSIPCDQRYEKVDMLKIIDTITNYYK